MPTPESKVKAQINKVLDARGKHLYRFMSVPNGYGSSTLDYLGAYRGHAFAIEAKAEGKKPMPRQYMIIDKLVAADVVVFVIDGDTDNLERWLDTLDGEEVTKWPSIS